MRNVPALLLILLAATAFAGAPRSSAQTVVVTCLLYEDSALSWGEPNQGIVEGPKVPPGEVWQVRSAGIFGDNYGGEYMLQHHVPVTLTDGTTGYWFVPLERTAGLVYGTPYLALSREFQLREAEYISARVNGLAPGRKIGLLLSYDAYLDTPQCRP